MFRFQVLFAVFAVLVGPGQVQSNPIPIPGLHNTGEIDAVGEVDSHYSLIVSSEPLFPGPEAYVSGNRHPAWLPNTATSRWISPGPDGSAPYRIGEYVYRTTFDLTGLDPNTASITGNWAIDNQGLDVLINGISTGIAHKYNDSTILPGPFSEFDVFAISTGLVPGTNTLDFVTYNLDISPHGLHVQLSGTAEPIPEPSTLVLFGMAAPGLLVCAWRQRRPGITRSPSN